MKKDRHRNAAVWNRTSWWSGCRQYHDEGSFGAAPSRRGLANAGRDANLNTGDRKTRLVSGHNDTSDAVDVVVTADICLSFDRAPALCFAFSSL
mmetsp:Transcript_20376/g.46232  ORF Transcript_20376/g.46232 Transcript_20376/m.46232 type:complete len:94 (+) Transcript_20376:321-602(+)